MKLNNATKPTETVVGELVQDFRAGVKGSALGVLHWAKVLVRAHDELGEKYLNQFYSEIKLVRNKSTSKKLLTIGATSHRLEKFADRLPNAWTTLYLLASLPLDKFQNLVDSGRLTPFMTARDVWDVVRPESQRVGLAVKRLSLNLSTLNAVKRQELAKKLATLLQDFDVPLDKTAKATLDGFIGKEESKNETPV